jgi:hypothetical protein
LNFEHKASKRIDLNIFMNLKTDFGRKKMLGNKTLLMVFVTGLNGKKL